jgi:hypothetical protein
LFSQARSSEFELGIKLSGMECEIGNKLVDIMSPEKDHEMDPSRQIVGAGQFLVNRLGIGLDSRLRKLDIVIGGRGHLFENESVCLFTS